MKILSKLLIFINVYFVFGGALGLLIYFSSPEDYVFGTEVAGFSYNSAAHHIFTHVSILIFGIVGFLLRKLNVFNELVCFVICLIGLIIFSILL